MKLTVQFEMEGTEEEIKQEWEEMAYRLYAQPAAAMLETPTGTVLLSIAPPTEEWQVMP